MENPFINETVEPGKAKRPVLLTVLCVLTFIGAGFALLSCLMLATMSDQMTANVESVYSEMLGEETVNAMIVLLEQAKEMLPYTSLLTLLTLTGAVLMFLLKRIGLYLYAAAQLLMLLLPLLFGHPVSTSSVLFTLLFIILYALNYKALK